MAEPEVGQGDRWQDGEGGATENHYDEQKKDSGAGTDAHAPTERRSPKQI